MLTEVARAQRSGLSHRPAFTHLVLLASADADMAARLLVNPVEAAQSNRYYPIQLNADDRALLEALCTQIHAVDELLQALAFVADGIWEDTCSFPLYAVYKARSGERSRHESAR